MPPVITFYVIVSSAISEWSRSWWKDYSLHISQLEVSLNQAGPDFPTLESLGHNVAGSSPAQKKKKYKKAYHIYSEMDSIF